MSYFAEINQTGVVVRVIVSDSITWCQARLGGNWTETKYDSTSEQYAGPGMGAEVAHPAKFARQWRQPIGASDSYQIGTYVWHNDRIYLSTSPNNVWEPTVFGWRDKTDLIPAWRQPLGAGDVWNLNDEVLHKNRHWRSLIANNVWEPGAIGSESLWADITETQPPPAIPDWVQPTGAHDAYALNAKVRFGGQVWESTINANVWAPGTASLWKVVT